MKESEIYYNIAKRITELEQQNIILTDSNVARDLIITELERRNKEIIEAFRELLSESFGYYSLYPNSHRKTAEEYFKDEFELLQKYGADK